jgi:hypothetical protein
MLLIVFDFVFVVAMAAVSFFASTYQDDVVDVPTAEAK